MKFSVRNLALWIATASVLGWAAPAFAQTPVTEFQIAYQALHFPDTWLARGINVDGAANINSVVGLVFEVGGVKKTSDDTGLDITVSVTNFGAGLRFSSRSSARVTPYVQALVGGVHGKFAIQSGNIGLNAATTRFMFQPGAGVNVKLGRTLGLFGAGDYRWVSLPSNAIDDSGQNQFRVLVGIRIEF